MGNHLAGQTSPYLLQHAENPVDWYPWGEAAFARAKAEDKPVFLSVGYSSCHWCHVMAHESFEDGDVAAVLNRYFVSVKVDREERPDVDAVYMAACEAFTGGGGWPLSVFLTPEKKPFFAGTYFPKEGREGQTGFLALLQAIAGAWRKDRAGLLASAERAAALVRQATEEAARPAAGSHGAPERLLKGAFRYFSQTFDRAHGGFGVAPKFPMGHQLLFLLDYHQATGDGAALAMAEKTLAQMYKGGLFDHIGFGFCRYSTDRRFLIPHFEKMLYDNALLIAAYTRAHTVTGAPFYRRAARETADYILREMTGPDGEFYSAQDADSEGREGGYYALGYGETLNVLGGERGRAFCAHFGITPQGNFEGKSIPNLLHEPKGDESWEAERRALYGYRRRRGSLGVDDKVLAGWNGLMIAALAGLAAATGEGRYLDAARRAEAFLAKNLLAGAGLRVSFRAGQGGGPGYLEDYAFYCLGLTALYDATLETGYLRRARSLAQTCLAAFHDEEQGGFFLSGKGSERMLLSPKPTYDGALPSGNSAMAQALVSLSLRVEDPALEAAAKAQVDFMAKVAARGPASYSFFLRALLQTLYPPERIVCVPAEPMDWAALREKAAKGAAVAILEGPQGGYGLLNGRATYYVCREHTCLPPMNDLREAAR